jgi:hypothetical protein
MGNWFTAHWFDLIQTIGIIGGLIFTAYAVRKDNRSRQISNLIAINERYNDIWQEFFRHPKLSRVLQNDVDLKKTPISDEEQLFVKMLVIHLNTIHRAMKAGMFVKIEEIQNDIRDFISLPIPKGVWEKIKRFQDQDFLDFVESTLK